MSHLRNVPLIHDEKVFLACSCGWWVRKDIARTADYTVCMNQARHCTEQAWMNHIVELESNR